MIKFKLNFSRKSVLLFLSGFFLGVTSAVILYLKSSNEKTARDESYFGKPIIEVDGKQWTTLSLPKESVLEYYNLQSNINSAESHFASQAALRIVLAKDQGKNIGLDTYPSLKELLDVQPIDDKEVKKYYEEHYSKIGQNYDKIKNQLKQQLYNQKISDYSNNKVRDYIKNNRIKLLINNNEPSLFNIDMSGYPIRGNKDSDLVFLNIFDFVDSKSRVAENELREIYDKYSSKIKFISIVYPLYPSGLSGMLARGAFCAKEQGDDKYWKYHENVFKTPISFLENSINNINKTHDLILRLVKSAKVDEKLFSSCLSSDESSHFIQNLRFKLSATEGLKGVPSFYFNRKNIQTSLKDFNKFLKSQF